MESIKPKEWQQGGKFVDEGFYTVEKLLASRQAHIREHAATVRQLLGILSDNDRCRICFHWTENGPDQVEIIDYH